MIPFILVLTMSGADHPPATYAVALMIDKSACTVAGTGMTQVLEAANPGLTVTFACLPEGQPA